MTFTFADPTEWWLELPPTVRAEAWQQSQSHATPSSRWNAYLNHLCLSALLPWIQEDAAAQAWLNGRDRSAIWELVNGTAIAIGATRLVLIPTEATDDGELEVPQEWVDLPSWAGDYYLAVQVGDAADSDPWLRVWGYTTHLTLRTSSRYDPDDRSYCLDANQLNRDLSSFWVTQRYCAEAQTRADVAPLPELSPAQAENLIQRLANRAMPFPRLAIPFGQWGALLERREWRQRLVAQRQTDQQSDRSSQFTNLSQWLQNQIGAGWQSIEALLGATPDLAFNVRSGVSEAETMQAKLLELGSEEATVMLVVGLRSEPDQRVGIRVQIHPTRSSAFVPANLTLSLLSETGEPLQSVQATPQDNYIQLPRFRCSTGTRFRLQVSLDRHQITEDFVV